MEVLIYVGLFLAGSVLGSFACCQTWRLRNKDKSRRSHCMKCEYGLRWFDMIPVVSWLVLRGRCRKCGGKIGVAELLSEVGLGVVFVGTYWLWPSSLGEWWGVAMLGVFLATTVGMLILFSYDLRWQELPVKVLVFCVVCAGVFAGVRMWWTAWITGSSPVMTGEIWSLVGALLILPGLYYALYKASRERWMGGGDWLVALMCALVLGDWWLALVCVFVANLLGSVVGLVIMKRRKRGRKMRIAFGPFLMVAMLLVFFAQGWLLGLI